MALEASAEERDTRGFISMTTMRPSAGLMPNCTLEPPVSTPISRSTASEASRMIWYSLSVSVSAGATVMESPVWTPIGSMFSIEQMMMQLSFLSRTTSISYSFQPSTLSSTSTSLVGRGVDAALDDGEIFFVVIGNAAAGAAQGEAGADDAGQADHLERLQRLDGVVRQHGARGFEPDLLHGVAEQFAVFGLVDGLGGGADHLDAELFEHAHLAQAERAVQRRLAAHGGQQRVGALLLDDLGDHFGGDRLHIGGVGQVRIGHDRRRIGVHQDDPVALFLERLAGLGAGIIELAGLPDDDRTRTDDEDRFDVGTFWHWCSLLVRGARGKTRGGAGWAADSVG